MQIRDIRLAFVAVGFCLCPSLFAVGYTWDFTGSAGTNCTTPNYCSSASAGNSITFNSGGGPTVTATAWYVGQGGTFQAATLGQYAGGLGVCYPGVDCTTLANQQLSNQSSDAEFILFQFSKPVDPSSINIQSLTNSGLDVSYWLGGTGQNLNLTNDNLTSSLSSLGFGPRTDSNGTSGTTRVVDLTGGTPAGAVDAVLFGAKYPYNSSYNDQFLIRGMAGVVTNPEPSAIILLFTITLFGFGITRRAKRKPQQVSD
jgi:hypothetical protein